MGRPFSPGTPFHEGRVQGKVLKIWDQSARNPETPSHEGRIPGANNSSIICSSKSSNLLIFSFWDAVLGRLPNFGTRPGRDRTGRKGKVREEALPYYQIINLLSILLSRLINWSSVFCFWDAILTHVPNFWTHPDGTRRSSTLLLPSSQLSNIIWFFLFIRNFLEELWGFNGIV